MSRIAPLIARVEPIAGETLLSLVARTAEAKVFPKLADLLGHAGVGGHPAFAPFTAVEQAQRLAELLGVAPDEVTRRFHPLHPDQTLKGAVDWAGVRMRRRSIEARTRRVAPLALRVSPHHRLEWTHRALSFCPETLQMLISSCPSCDARFGWVTSKGLDRCESCEASLSDVDAPLVQTRSPDRLRAAAGLISPDLKIRSAAQAALPPEFQTWDAGDLFAALCEFGVAWRRAEEGRSSATARALSDASYTFEPEDLARGWWLLRDWPTRRGELLDRLAAQASSHRTNGRLTSAHLGVLGRHLTPMSTGATLGGLLMRAVEAEAQGRRVRAERTQAEATALEERKVGSIGLVEACEAFGISRPVLKRLAPDGRAFISAQPRRLGGVRFDPDALAATVGGYERAQTATEVSRILGAPRYVVPALVEAGVLEACPDRDVELMFGERAVTGESVSVVRRALETRTSDRQTTLCLRRLHLYLRRRFDPTVWAAAIHTTLHDPHVHKLTANDGADRPLLERMIVLGDLLGAQLQEDDPRRTPRDARLSARETGRLLGLSSTHLPELVAAGLLKGSCEAEGWSYRLGDVMNFHAGYVTASELRQRHDSPVYDLYSVPGIFEEEFEPSIKLTDVAEEIIRTRHFSLAPREEVESGLEWPDLHLR